MIDQRADEYEDPASNQLERRWFAALTAVRAAQSECDVLRQVTEQAEAAWRSARARLEVLERLRDRLGETLAALDGDRAEPAPRDLRPCALPPARSRMQRLA